MILTPNLIKSTSNKFTYHLISEEDGLDFQLQLGKNIIGRNFFMLRVKLQIRKQIRKR